MTPFVFDFELYQGTHQSVALQWFHDSEPVDLTGALMEMQVRGRAADRAVVDTLSTANGRIVASEAAEGKFQLDFTHEQSLEYDAGTLVYDIKVTRAGLVDRPVTGTIEVVPAVTR